MELPALRRSKLHLLLLLMSLALSFANVRAQAPTEAPSPSPAPAPAPEFANISQVLVFAGDFSTFLSLLDSTGVGEKFQKQANETDVGITVFAPTDKAFAAEPAATLLRNVSGQQLQSLLEYHALDAYESLSDLQTTSNNVTATFATFNGGGGGRYLLNLTNVGGQTEIVTDWNKAFISTTVYDTRPLSIFALNQVLLPEELFGLPAPAPAPSPLSGAPLTSPSSSPGSSSAGSSGASGPSGSNKSFAPLSFSPHPLDSLLLLLPFLFLELF